MSDEDNIEPFQVAFTIDGEAVVFATLGEFQVWLDKCSSDWLSIRDQLDRKGLGSSNVGTMNLANRFVAERMEFFDHFRMICAAISHKKTEFKREVIGDIVNNIVKKTTAILPTGDLVQEFIQYYFQSKTDQLAGFMALNDGYLLNSIRKYMHPSFSDISTGFVVDEFQARATNIAERIEALETQIPEIVRSELGDRLDTEKAAVEREAAEMMLADAGRKWKDTLSIADASQKKVVTMEATLASYMDVQAPAVYWSSNAKKYALTGSWALICAIFTVIVVASISVAAILFADRLDFYTILKTFPEFALYFLLAVPIVCAFILIRIFTNIYNVSRALSDDNRQRSAMAKSLVSLVQSTEDGLRDEERLVIFRSLFRPSQDYTGKNELDIRHPVEVLVNRMTGGGKK